MESSMELDDLKQAWQTLDRRLVQNHALQFEAFRERRVGKLKRHLSMLRFGQVLQMLFGIVVVLIAVAFWRSYWQEPAMLATGIVMHAYGVLVIAVGGMIQGRISGIDRSLPVLGIQKRLAALRRTYVVGGMWVGLPWALLWVLCAVMLARSAAGINLYVNAPVFVYPSLVAGVLTLFGVRQFHRWSRHPSRPQLAQRLEDSLTASSIRRAQAELDDIQRFEAE